MTDKATKSLAQAMLSLETEQDAIAFLEDLCTPQELEDLATRWTVVDELNQGYTYREIHAHTKASLTTIGRIAKAMRYGSGGYNKVYEKVFGKKKTGD